MADALGDRAIRFARPRNVSARAIVRAVRAWPGVVDVVVAKEDIAAYFDRAPEIDEARIRALPEADDDPTPVREIEIRAVYDGPDLDDIARAVGLDSAEIARIHAAATYVVETMGFAPGFAYLDGLDPRLKLPRRSTPRVRVAAGSIGIAGDQTAVYPFESPGGWHLVGRTNARMFGPEGSLLRLGDRVPLHVLTIVRAFGLVTIQDLGRPGRMHEAIPKGGAMVPELCVAANRAVHNPDGAAAIEVMGKLVVRAESDTLASVDGESARVVRAGEELVIAPKLRVSYLAIRGGVDAPIVLGGRGALLCAGLGALLRSGDRISAGLEPDVAADPPASPGAGPVRIVPGPDDFAPGAIDALTASPYRISEASDRVGTRLEGPPIERLGSLEEGNERSRPMVRGGIEIPRDGKPIVLGPEHPTTGGYPLVAVIAASDLGRFFAVPLGGTVRFIVC